MKSTSNIESRAGARRDPSPGLVLEILPATFGIFRLAPTARVPRWIRGSRFTSVCRSPEELSIVCEDHRVPTGAGGERGWKAIRVRGTLDMSLIGVLASMAAPLAEAKIGLFTVSTYDTDYLLVRESKLELARSALEAVGHRFDQEPIDASPPATAESVADRLPPLKAPAAVEDSVAPELGADASPALGSTPSAPSEPPPRRTTLSQVLAEFGLAVKKRRRGGPSKTKEAEPASPEAPAASEAVEPTIPTAVAPRVPEAMETRTGAPDAQEEASETPGAERPSASEISAPEAETPPAAEPPEPPRRASARDADEDEGARAQGLFSGAIPQHPVEITDKSFDDLGLSEPIRRTVREVGFEHPTPIQVGVIPKALEGHDVIGLAETGSGKTAAFCLPLAERLRHGRGLRGLILCPTREIALQGKAFLDIFGRDHELETAVVIGGVRMGPQIQGLRRDPDIVVATPGRLADHMRRRNVRLNLLEELVLDEADHMLDLGFLPQIREILEQVPTERRTMMFSATMPPPIERLAQHFMRDPVRVDLRPAGRIASGIEHRLYLVREEDKKKCLVALLRQVTGTTLVFSRRKLYTEWLARQLEGEGLSVTRIHSDRTQAQRVQALKAFRDGKSRILVATDVAARGIDVPHCEHVINYDLPEQVEDYVHRAGRTARGSAGGVVSTIGTWQDKLMVRELEVALDIKMPRSAVKGVEPYVELPKKRVVRRRRLL